MGVCACHEAFVVAPLCTVDLPFVPPELVYLVWRTHVEQRESAVCTADGKDARARAPRERTDAHPVGIRPRSHTALRGRIPHLHAACSGTQCCIQPARRKGQRTNAAKAGTGKVAEMCDLSRIKVLVVDVVSAGDGNDVGRGPGKRVRPGVLGDTGTIESKDELSPLSEMCSCGCLMNGWRGIKELGGVPAQRGEHFTVGGGVCRVSKLKEPVICKAEYFCHPIGAWCCVHWEQGLWTSGNEAICLSEGQMIGISHCQGLERDEKEQKRRVCDNRASYESRRPSFVSFGGKTNKTWNLPLVQH